jgi:hypothetical protein
VSALPGQVPPSIDLFRYGEGVIDSDSEMCASSTLEYCFGVFGRGPEPYGRLCDSVQYAASASPSLYALPV